MTIQQLDYAIKLAHFQSYKRAAQELGISQPALSMQIQKLEEELSLVLFDRTRKKVEVTEKGQLILQKATILLNEANQIHQLAHRLHNEMSGELNIGIIPTLAPYLVPLFINQLNNTFDRLKINIKEALTEEIIHDLKVGTLDGGIISTPIRSSYHFQTQPLFYEGFKVFVSPLHALYAKDEVDISEISMKDVWLLKEGNCFRDQVNNICELNGARKEKESQELFYFESNSIESLSRIVEFKGGITFLPELTTLHISVEKEDMIKELAGEKKIREISLINLPNHVRAEDMQAFAEIIKRNIPRHLLNKGNGQTVPTNINV